MTPEGPHQRRDWFRFLHRLWVVAGTVWLVAATFSSFHDTWLRKIPSSDVYYRHERCMELQERIAHLPPESDLPRPTDIFDAVYAEGESDRKRRSDPVADEIWGTPTPTNAFDRIRARKAREEENALNAALPGPTTSVYDRLRAEKAREARENLELQAGSREAECVGAALAITDSRARFRQAAGEAGAVGLGIPLAILAIGHGIAWAVRGLRADP